MEKKRFYTPMEEVLIKGALLAQGGTVPHDQVAICGDDIHEEVLPAAPDRLELGKLETAALELDLMLLEMEAKMDMMDGHKLEEWIL